MGLQFRSVLTLLAGVAMVTTPRQVQEPSRSLVSAAPPRRPVPGKVESSVILNTFLQLGKKSGWENVFSFFLKVCQILSIRLHKLEKCAYQRTRPKSSLFTNASVQKVIDNFVVTLGFT